MKPWPTIFFAALFLWQVAGAQEFRIQRYRVTEGLPSDFSKGIIEDSLGFIWVCTDYGLARLEGNRVNVFNRPLVNQFTKELIRSRDGSLIAIGDQDVLKIESRPDTVVFKRLATGTHNPTDTSVWYPKSIFEDKSGSIWLAEPQAVSRIQNGKIARYMFDMEDRTPIFTRSFSFLENERGDLFVTSFPGNLFRYNPNQDKFEKLAMELPRSIYTVRTEGENIWIGADGGLFHAKFLPGGMSTPRLFFPASSVSSILLTENFLWVANYLGDLIQLGRTSDGVNSKPLNAFHFDVVNGLYLSRSNDLWVSTDKGVLLLQHAIFEGVKSTLGMFVESVVGSEPGGLAYFAIKEALFELDKDKRRPIYENAYGYFQGLAMRGDSLWATNAFSVMLFRKNRLVKTWDFSNEGQFIHEILVDRAGHVWFCQDGTDSVSTFDLNLSRKKMRVPVQPGSNVIALCEGSAGMYAISNSSRSYLFLKERGSDVFKDISVKPAFPVHEELGLVDIAMHENRVWLASSQGLLRYYNGRLEKIDLGTRYKNHSVKVVHSFDKEHILFGNAFGLFLYNTVTGYILLYDETTGLPSNATTPRGICVASTGQIWVGTSYGVSFSSSPLKSQGKSPAPMVSSIRVNGITAMLTNQLEVPYHSLVSITVSAPIFPEKMMQLEWRVPGSTPEWHVIENDQFDLVEVSEGVMEVEIRARKMGYDYSDFAVVHINVSGPFWQSAYFVIGVILLIALVVWVSVAVTKQNQRKRQQWLEQQIQIHTQELSLRNKELDSFVYSTSHDLSAPLRSILGLITVARMENPPPNQLEYLAKMEQSVHKLQNFIKDVINYSRNLRMPVKREDIDFVPFVNAILADHQFANNFGKIEFEVIDSVKSPVVLDSLRLRIILNNLISNAIKFHWIGRPNEAPKVWIELSRQQNLLRLVVKDNGRGIDSVHMKNLFGMFYRATDNAAGSGLGLYILKEAVTKMGGKVTVQSALGEGTEFTITIPHFESADPPADV